MSSIGSPAKAAQSHHHVAWEDKLRRMCMHDDSDVSAHSEEGLIEVKHNAVGPAAKRNMKFARQASGYTATEPIEDLQ